MLAELRRCFPRDEAIIGPQNILGWFLKHGFTARYGTLSWRTVRKWITLYGCPITNLPNHTHAPAGQPWTTAHLLTVWCVTEAKGRRSPWHRQMLLTRRDDQKRARRVSRLFDWSGVPPS
jgi:hypothetical protein